MTHLPAGPSRRHVLRAGLSLAGAAVLSPALPAAAARPAIVVRPSDHGSAQHLQAAVDEVAAQGGGTVLLSPGTYALDSTVHLRSGVVLEGASPDRTLLVDDPALGAQPLVTIEGTAGRPVTGAGLRRLCLRNGTASEGSFTRNKDGLRVADAADVELTEVRVTEIQGAYGVRVQRTDRITAEGCHFYRCTYAMFMILPDCTDVVVRASTFDTVTTLTSANCYTLATGAEAYDSGQRWTRGLTVERCRFLNNPRWEGLDTHGAQQVRFRHNYIEGCYFGILVANARGYVAEAVTEDVIVEGNTIVQGNGRPGGYGIVVNGDAARTRDVVLRDNHIRGFGGVHPSIGVIQLYGTEATQIVDNTIEDFGINAITLYHSAFGTVVSGNTIRNAAPVAEGTVTSAVRADSWGVHDADVRDNVVTADSPGGQVDYFVSALAPNQSWQIGENDLGGVRRRPAYRLLDVLPVHKDEMPVTGRLQQRAGDILRGSDMAPAWVVTSPPTGIGSLDTETVAVLVDMQAGSPVATLRPGGSYDWRSMPPGMNVVVTGAGDGGADLRAQVVANSGSVASGVTFVLQLDAPARTTVISAPVRFQGLAFAPA